MRNSTQLGWKPMTAVKQAPEAQPRANIQVLMYQPPVLRKDEQSIHLQRQQGQPSASEALVKPEQQGQPIVIPQLVFGQGRLMHGVQTARTVVTGADHTHISGRVSEAVEVSRPVVASPPLSKKNTLVEELEPKPEYEALREMYRNLEQRFHRLETDVVSHQARSDRQHPSTTRSRADLEELISARIR